MVPYIMLNTRLRTDAKHEFEKYFFKLMNSSIFGKTMENIRNHEQKYKKYVLKPNFKDDDPFFRDLFAVEMGKTKIKLNKQVPSAGNIGFK